MGLILVPGHSDALATYLLSLCIGGTLVRYGRERQIHALPLVVYLLDTTNADLAASSRRVTSRSATIELYELLVEYEHDLALSDQEARDQRVLDTTKMNELFMGKLLAPDASVEHDYSESILDTCA